MENKTKNICVQTGKECGFPCYNGCPIYSKMKKYNIIYADPAWDFKRGVNDGVYQDGGRNIRSVKQIYSTMSLEDMKNMPIQNISDKDCILFMWTTDSHLDQAIDLIKCWGFKYKTIGFIWKKITNKGNTCANVGAWTMKNCEVCLLATKGSMAKYKIRRNIFQLVESERGRHSEKPNEVRKRITEIFGNELPKIELFARENFKGWDAWGNEVENSITI